MSSLREINNRIYIDDELLIDFHKPIYNVSRLPLYQKEMELKSLFWTLCSLLHSGKNKDRFGEQIVYNEYYELIYYLISKYMIRISGTKTTRTVELGADNWVLSYHLCTLLGAFHEDNEYYLVTDAKDPDSVLWLKNRINTEKSMKNVTLVNSDYKELSIDKKHFDFVILNGSPILNDPEGMVTAALDLVKDHGIIIAFNQFYNTVFDDLYSLKSNNTIYSFKSYMLDDENAEVIVIET